MQDRDRKFLDTRGLNNTVRDYLIAHFRAEVRLYTQEQKDLALYYFAENGGLTALQVLLEEKANPNAFARKFAGPLHIAAHKSDRDMVKLLLEFGADPNSLDDQGFKASSYAEFQNTPEILQKAEADPTSYVQIRNENRIHRMEIAIRQNRFTDLKNLFDKDTDANQLLHGTDGFSLLMLAASEGHLRIAEFLISRGADVNFQRRYDNQTALMWAAAEGHPRMIRLLVASGARLKTVDNGRRTALHHAVWKIKPSSVRALLDLGANIESRDNDGRTPLLWSNRNVGMMTLLVKRGANPNVEAADGTTLLENLKAQKERGYSFFEEAIEYLEGLFASGKYPRTPSVAAHATLAQRQSMLNDAVEKANLIKIDEVLALGPVDIQEAFIIACVQGKKKSFDHLVQKGFDWKFIDPKTGNNLLHFAAGEGKLTLVKQLVQMGIDKNLENIYGATPEDLAFDNGMDRVAAYLRRGPR